MKSKSVGRDEVVKHVDDFGPAALDLLDDRESN